MDRKNGRRPNLDTYLGRRKLSDSSKAAVRGELAGASSIVALALALVATPAAAQTPTQPGTATTASPAATETGDEIIVTGIRASLAKSIREKRQSDSMIEAINAEDIGKFPDSNIAESLQRVPGVAIDRSAGEGRFASINGLGPEFVSVLLNGRTLANDNPDRSFSFDTLATEIVSTVKVYKTANAIVPEGGVAGTIDVITAKPFDYDGFKLNVRAGALYEETAKKTTPQGSFMISDRFLDGRLGILASFNYFERRNRTYQTRNSAVLRKNSLYFDLSAYPYVYSDDTNENAFRMQDLERVIDDTHRTRYGGTLVAQFEASDNLVVTADYLYSKFKSVSEQRSLLNYFYAVQPNNRNIKDSAGVLTTFDHALDYRASGFAYINLKEVRPVTTNALGLNAKWTPGNKFSAVFDLSGSRTINDNRGLDRVYILEALNKPGFLVITPPGGVPYLQGPNLFVPSTANVGDLRARQTSDSGTYVKSENWQFKADMKYQPSDNFFINFGGSYAAQRKQNEFWQTPRAVSRLYQSNATGQPIDTNSIVTGINRPGDVFGNSKLNGDMFVFDGEALRRWMADPVNIANRTKNPTAGGLQEFIANGRTWNAVKSGDSYVVNERVTSFYADAHAKVSLFDRPLDIVAGLRYTSTRQTSSGTTRIPIGFTNTAGGPSEVLGVIYASNALTAISVENKYDNFLPSANVKWAVTNNIDLRLSASKTLTRPILEDLAPTFNYVTTRIANRQAKAGNVFLRPFTSVNLDASLEYYYKKGSGISLSYFHKRISDYIVVGTNEEKVTTIVNPTGAQNPNNVDFQTVTVTRPQNAGSAKIDGFTAALLHSFNNGFGFSANYTKLSGKLSAPTVPGAGTRVSGLSDSANVVGYYEDNHIGLRVAYNWRDRFLANSSYAGITNSPRYFQPFYQIDARLSVNLPAGIALALDVENLTQRKVRSYGISEGAFIGYADYGRRWTISASKKF